MRLNWEVVIIKIPKLSQINETLKILKPGELFDEAMCNLATHHVKNSLIYLVLYIHKTGYDLSKEILDLAHNPASLNVCVKVARSLGDAENDRLNVNFNESTSSDISSKPKNSSSQLINDTRNKVIHEMNKRSLSGINVVLVDKDHNIYRYHYNDLSSLPQADLGLDLIKNDLMLKANGSSHDIGDSDEPGNFDGPDDNNGDYGYPTISFVKI